MKTKKILAFERPDLLKEWDFEKNALTCSPDEAQVGSHKKVWWKCKKCSFEWKTEIRNRVKGSKCPACTGLHIVPGLNDLVTKRLDLLQEWNYTKNTVKPSEIGVNSHKKVWWICSKGHEWEATIANRNNGTKCPYCFGTKVAKGENDFQTLYPHIAKEWHESKNGYLHPCDIRPGSNKKVWWRCSICGNEWQTTPNHRTHESTGCPKCNKQSSSFSEQIVYFYVKQFFDDAISRYKTTDDVELDVYIPSEKIGIEYDGLLYHKNKKRGMPDIEKNQYCYENHIKIFRIREKGLEDVNGSVNFLRLSQTYSSLKETIDELLSTILSSKTNIVPIEDNLDLIFSDYIQTSISNSLLHKYPKLAREWNYGKNGHLYPEYFLPRSNKKVWWICSKGHEYLSSISHRVEGKGCPYCSGRKVLCGYNDLKTMNPILGDEWNVKKT